MYVTGWELVAVLVVIVAGACLQGSIGFGMAVLSLPFFIFIEPDLLPQSMLVTSLPFVVLMAIRNWGEFQWREVIVLSLARIPGAVAGVVAVRMLSQDAIAVAAASAVIAAVALSAWAPAVERTLPVLTAAGFTSGLFGTAAAIGGPPMALVFQRETGPRIRSTMSIMATVSIAIALTSLSLGGQIQREDFVTGMVMAPASIVGLGLSRFVIPYSDRRLRTLVLLVCAVAAAAAIAKVVLT